MTIKISYQKATALLKKMNTTVKDFKADNCNGFSEAFLLNTGAKIKYDAHHKVWYVRTYGCNISGIL